MLRTLANDLRQEAEKRADLRRKNAALVLVAATGLSTLQRQLGGTRG